MNIFNRMLLFLLASGLSVFLGCSSLEGNYGASVATDDQQLERVIQDRLESDPVSSDQSFGVSSRNGVVTVSGSVATEAGRGRVLGIVRGTPGVKGVRDNLFKRSLP